MPKIKHILITSDSASFDAVEEWCAKRSYALTRAPQIQTKPILNLAIPQTDWIFFSSPKGAALYMAHYPIKAKKIAVYGEGTKAELTKAHLNIDFRGKMDQSSSQIGRNFAKHIGTVATVLFPLSDRSLKTIYHEIPSQQRIEINTYQTKLTPSKFHTPPSIILFTSPSNFESYTSLYQIEDKTQLIAIGKSTEQEIAKKYRVDFVLEAPTSEAFTALLEQI